MTSPTLALAKVSKRYPNGTLALDRVDLEIRAGEVLALVGENGAGKSTAMKVLFGLEAPSSGEIRVRGTAARFAGPADAIAAGIGLVPQHVQLVPSFTVAQNVVLGREPVRGGLVDVRVALAGVAATAARTGLDVAPATRVDRLSIGERQRVEILKALHRRANVLLLDEPSAVLAPQESARLFETLRRLAGEGLAVVIITHSLAEVMTYSDRHVVLRAGRVVAADSTRKAGADRLVERMMGQGTRPVARPRRSAASEALVRVRDLSATTLSRPRALVDVDLDIGASEILGIAGVEGSGQGALADVLCGFVAPTRGSASVAGVVCTGCGVRHAREAGVAMVTEDRLHDGVAPHMSLRDNLVAATYRRPPLSRRGVLDEARASDFARDEVARHGIVAESVEIEVGALSGGNMQKVVIARELAAKPRLLVACQPSRGVDVAAAELLHGRLATLRDAGSAILLASSDLDELRARCDRLVVMYRGRIVAHLRAADASPEAIGGWMSGARGEAPVPARLDSPFSSASGEHAR
jgi:ABC-type uncharacterized transport system ATPase subunit